MTSADGGVDPARRVGDQGWNWSARRETPAQRADRNFGELLQELRVVQTGVQILFALLLTVAFTGRFQQADALQLALYVVSLVSTAATAVLLMAPVAYHRRVFGRGRKRQLVGFADVLLQLGMAALCVAMLSALLLVLDFVLGTVPAVSIVLPIAALFVLLWFLLPLHGTRREPDRLAADARHSPLVAASLAATEPPIRPDGTSE